ncbi:hypothetical protein QBC32DRAFT_357140 [Pseudoneurospora amorphoporcata]|uniref:Uncharacterized protein n=1 Tax=Pseudoneurospora amorphoporcata TaxID=241081 RepID=A0AAN6SA37_9PEZI|nr:hypothetical protein QBC32DRAFT_357140 [Pseudoneurospora amorphoporcata]
MSRSEDDGLFSRNLPEFVTANQKRKRITSDSFATRPHGMREFYDRNTNDYATAPIFAYDDSFEPIPRFSDDLIAKTEPRREVGLRDCTSAMLALEAVTRLMYLITGLLILILRLVVFLTRGVRVTYDLGQSVFDNNREEISFFETAHVEHRPYVSTMINSDTIPASSTAESAVDTPGSVEYRDPNPIIASDSEGEEEKKPIIVIDPHDPNDNDKSVKSTNDTPSVSTRTSLPLTAPQATTMTTPFLRTPFPKPREYAGLALFNGSNVTEYLRYFNECCEDYGIIQDKALVEHWFRWCDIETRGVAEGLAEDNDYNWEAFTRALRAQFKHKDPRQRESPAAELRDFYLSHIESTKEGLIKALDRHDRLLAKQPRSKIKEIRRAAPSQFFPMFSKSLKRLFRNRLSKSSEEIKEMDYLEFREKLIEILNDDFDSEDEGSDSDAPEPPKKVKSKNPA